MGGWRSRLCRTRLLAAPAFRTNVYVARKSEFCSSGLGGRDHCKLQKPFSHHSSDDALHFVRHRVDRVRVKQKQCAAASTRDYDNVRTRASTAALPSYAI